MVPDDKTPDIESKCNKTGQDVRLWLHLLSGAAGTISWSGSVSTKWHILLPLRWRQDLEAVDQGRRMRRI